MSASEKTELNHSIQNLPSVYKTYMFVYISICIFFLDFPTIYQSRRFVVVVVAWCVLCEYKYKCRTQHFHSNGGAVRVWGNVQRVVCGVVYSCPWPPCTYALGSQVFRARRLCCHTDLTYIYLFSSFFCLAHKPNMFFLGGCREHARKTPSADICINLRLAWSGRRQSDCMWSERFPYFFGRVAHEYIRECHKGRYECIVMAMLCCWCAVHISSREWML